MPRLQGKAVVSSARDATRALIATQKLGERSADCIQVSLSGLIESDPR
jgi:hypothetical protein